MTCTVSEEQLFSWIDRQAPDLEDHLAVCEECRQRTQALRHCISDVRQSVTASHLLRVPENIGHYQIRRLIGVGGQGWVFEAQQPSPRRNVALKVVKGGGLIDGNDARRIRLEADTLALLRHTGIANVYEGGCTEDGQQYFAMELVNGEPLLVYARSRHYSIRQRIELFLKVCDALDYAHQQGVIHRDLKPSNILVEHDDQPKILDFGLAKVLSPDRDLTATLFETGNVLGTLPFMSPEHAQGQPGAITAASDLYCLCVILYELLCDHPPYDLTRKPPHQALRVICEQQPIPPSRFQRKLAGDLETILLKGLEKEPQHRYASVADFANDLRRYLDGKPISARRPSTFYRASRWVARNRLVAALMLMLTITTAGFAAWIGTIFSEARYVLQRAGEPISGMEYGLMLADLAETRWAANQLTVAERLCSDALQAMLTQLPETNRVVLTTRVLLGRIKTRQGYAKEAEPLLRKSMQNLAEYHPDQKILVAEAKSALGECLTRMGTYRQAELLLLDSHPVIEQYHGATHRRTLEARAALVDLYTAWNKPDLAQRYRPYNPTPIRTISPRAPAPGAGGT